MYGPKTPSTLRQILSEVEMKLSRVRAPRDLWIDVYFEEILPDMFYFTIYYIVEENDRYFRIGTTINASPEYIDPPIWSKYFGKCITILEKLDFTPIAGDRWRELVETTPPVLDYDIEVYEIDEAIHIVNSLRRELLRLKEPDDWPEGNIEKELLRTLLEAFVKDYMSSKNITNSGWRSLDQIYNICRQNHVSISRSTTYRRLRDLAERNYIMHGRERKGEEGNGRRYRIHENTLFAYATLAEVNYKAWRLLWHEHYLRNL